MKMVTAKFQRNIACKTCEKNTTDAMKQEEKLCDDEEIVRELRHLCDQVSAGERCWAAVIARCGLIV